MSRGSVYYYYPEDEGYKNDLQNDVYKISKDNNSSAHIISQLKDVVQHKAEYTFSNLQEATRAIIDYRSVYHSRGAPHPNTWSLANERLEEHRQSLRDLGYSLPGIAGKSCHFRDSYDADKLKDLVNELEPRTVNQQAEEWFDAKEHFEEEEEMGNASGPSNSSGLSDLNKICSADTTRQEHSAALTRHAERLEMWASALGMSETAQDW